MPIVDLPLEQLKTYAGTNPKPADFDQFWDKSLEELADIDPELELRSAQFQTSFAECFHLYFTGTGGARIHTKYIRPKGAENCPVVLQFHGYSASSGEWNEKLKFVAAGFCVAAMDCRGQAGMSTDPGGTTGPTLSGHIIRGLRDQPAQLLFRHIFLDTARLAQVVMDLRETDATRVVATGGSQGGGLTLACAALEPRVKRAGPAFPFLCDYQRVCEMDLDMGAYEELRKFFRNFDPRHEQREEIFTKLGYIDVQHLAPRIKAEVFMGLGLMDTITPPSSCFAAYNKITSPKEVVVYPNFGHEGLPGWDDQCYQFLTGV
jgi:cephalosporin-C deacetylase